MLPYGCILSPAPSAYTQFMPPSINRLVLRVSSRECCSSDGGAELPPTCRFCFLQAESGLLGPALVSDALRRGARAAQSDSLYGPHTRCSTQHVPSLIPIKGYFNCLEKGLQILVSLCHQLWAPQGQASSLRRGRDTSPPQNMPWIFTWFSFGLR